jgi:glycosyltransferase involved in cell wall biosynthesis
MHIVALTNLFYPAQGGTEISLRQLGEGLVKKGHRVTVITSNQVSLEAFKYPRVDLSLKAEEVREGIRILRLPLTLNQRFILAKTGALALRSRLPGGDRLWFMTQVPHLPQMIKTARELNPDLIYAVPFPTASIYYASVAAKKTGCPWVIQPHLHMKDINSSLMKILRWIFPKASAILTNTRAEKAYLTKQGIQEGKIHVMGQGIDLSLLEGGDGPRFRSGHGLTDEPLILFLGRKVENKGIDTLLEAMPLIWKEESRTILVLAGQSSPYFQNLYNSHPLSQDHRIISVDDFPEEEKTDLLKACDLLILPSQAESFGVVFLEAWAKGKPVIGARIPAVEEMIVDGEDGFLVPYGDPVGLANTAQKLIKNPVLRKTLGEKGKIKVEHDFEISRVTDRMEALFLSLIRLR